MLNFLLPQELQVGVCLDGSLVRKATIKASRSSFSVISLETENVQDAKNAIYASCIPSSKTIARTLEIGLTKQKDVDAAFGFEAEAHLPYPQEECLLGKVCIGQANGSTTLQLFSVLKIDVQQHLDALQEHAINPEMICPKPLALCHFVKRLYNSDALQIVIHVDRKETTCVLVQDGRPLIARSHTVGLDNLEAITSKNDDGQISINEEELDNLQQYLREISRILLAFQNGFDTGSLPILFCGPIVENSILIELFTNALEREIAPPPEKLPAKSFSWNELLVFAVPIGCALSISLEPAGESVNFRNDDFSYPDKWRRWKKELAVYFMLMIMISFGAYMYGKALLKAQTSAHIEQYATLLQVMEKPTPQDEIIALAPDDIEDKLYTLEEEIKKTSNEMALHPDVPRVSDLLAWLSSHPNIVIGGDDPKAISLESLAYSMVKRPEKGKLKEHYQVRVDLEFSAPSPTMARELHDALLTPNAFIDPKTELKWSVHRGHFKATFFLKDRTKYPQAIQGGEA